MADATGRSLDIKYDKSRYFRVINVDGVYGGVAPNGSLHLSPYSERYALPSLGRLDLDEAGRPIGEEHYVDRHNGVFREIEADLVIDFMPAIGLYVWLEQKLRMMAQHLGSGPINLV
ncbi:hypothetical protein [Rhizobium rhizosphaerae]|uniref:hypothetical protein n=1 Tax=Xaviernesmea rhizosphaerae TaxID=1672749 RepID=UPI00117A7CEE|nr:hypothetical protein [Xaviernesmea rhizosphaerae]